MEEFINTKDLQRIMNETSPSIHIGYSKARSLFRRFKDQYDCDGLLLPYENVIPLAWAEKELGSKMKPAKKKDVPTPAS